jgi:hypothetical protein
MLLGIIGTFSLSAPSLRAQSPIYDPLPPLVRMETRIDSLRLHYGHLLGKADLLAERIKLYRQKKDLNAREHGNLEKLLRRGQTLSSEVLETENVLSAFLGTYQTRLDSSLAVIETEMARLLAERPATKSSDPPDAKTYDQFQRLLAWKTALESRRKPVSLVSESGIHLTLAPDESSREIRMKGDMLLDREQLFRDEIRLIDDRIESLKIEANVRRKVRQMASEMDLFNEEDELLARNRGISTQGVPSATNEFDYWDKGETIGSSDSPASSYLGDPPASGESDIRLESRSPEAIDAAISSLSEHKSRLKSLADSLKIRSRQFYDEADRREEPPR